MSASKKRILLIDIDDPRRRTRVHLLQHAGYEVHVTADHETAAQLGTGAEYDLILLTLHGTKLMAAIAYGDALQQENPNLPILVLTDCGIFVPRGTLSRNMQSGGNPLELIEEIARMLVAPTIERQTQGDGKSLS